MLGVTLVQIMCAVGAVYFGAQVAMALGRDVRHGLFNRVQRFSAREVGHFGAPSLITRTTNDVQQVQMLVLMTCTLLCPRRSRASAASSWRCTRTCRCPRCCWSPSRCSASSCR